MGVHQSYVTVTLTVVAFQQGHELSPEIQSPVYPIHVSHMYMYLYTYKQHATHIQEYTTHIKNTQHKQITIILRYVDKNIHIVQSLHIL